MAEEHYFLGSTSPDGFVSSVKELTDNTDNTIYILKGTAGSGKSTLMKKISDAFSDSDRQIFHCSSDPFSLDAVYIKDKNMLIMDGTSPHCLDPVYPKAVQSIVDLGAYLEEGNLRKNKEDIIKFTDRCSACHKRVLLIISAASSVISDIFQTASSFVDRRKLTSFTARTVKRIISGRKLTGRTGKISTRQMSAITLNGYHTYLPSCDDLYVINDDYAAASDIFMNNAAMLFSKSGYDVTVSRCMISHEKFTEHIYIPELDTAFISSGFLKIIDVPSSANLINFRRFYDKDMNNKALSHRSKLRFGKKAVKELLSQASDELKAAKAVHDIIEEYYIASADFDSMNRLAYKLISDIRSL